MGIRKIIRIFTQIKKLMGKNTTQQITEYVYKNYKLYKDKSLIIKEYKNCFHILTHEDSSPLILGRKIING